MPAAAVIPALIAYIKVVAVKKLVVGFRDLRLRSGVSRVLQAGPFCLERGDFLLVEESSLSRTFTLNKLECLKQATA